MHHASLFRKVRELSSYFNRINHLKEKIDQYSCIILYLSKSIYILLTKFDLLRGVKYDTGRLEVFSYLYLLRIDFICIILLYIKNLILSYSIFTRENIG